MLFVLNYLFFQVGEVLPQATTPLAISILVPSFERGLLNNFLFAENSKYFNQIMGVSHNRIAMNVFNVFLRFVKSEISIENRVHGLSMFGHEFVTEDIHKIAVHRHGVTNKIKEYLLMLSTFKAIWTSKSKVKKLKCFMDNFKGTYNSDNVRKFKSSLDLYEDITMKIGSALDNAQNVHGMVSMITTIYQIVLFSILAENRNEMTQDYIIDITLLLSSCQNAESAEIPVLLENIVSTILDYTDDVKIKVFCEINPHDGVEWIKNNCADASKLFETFLNKHSHRGYQEVNS